MNTGTWQVSRRRFLQASGAAAACAVVPGFSLPAFGKTGLELLPKGAAPEPLALPHFPSAVHAFVWRNWPLVPAPEIAKVLDTKTERVEALARSMGLRPQARISDQQRQRSALTLIRRNWHLLPYDQLLILLGWTAEQLAFALREDDFLFVKLGNLKPRCPRLRFSPGGDSSRVRDIVAQEFSSEQKTEPLFSFLSDLSRKTQTKPRKPSGLRLCYSYFALYGDPLLDPVLDPYPEGYLARLSEVGVNAVWLQGVLHKLAPFPWQTDESRDHGLRLRNLRALAKRAQRHGIRIFLYLNEPRAWPDRFYGQHPALKGVTEGEFSALCTSHPEVREYLTESAAVVARAVPELGGFFTISASENLTNCWSHGAGAQCPRCRKRSAAEVIAEVNTALWRGIQRAGTGAELIVWDWGWADAWAEDAINRLPDGVSFMSVSEWSLPLRRGGVATTVGEYSISAVGPGPRALKHWAAARKRGLRVVAKIQAGNTWELSSVPYIPALQNVAQHALNLRDAGVRDVMLGWTLGGYPSPNLEVVGGVLEDQNASIEAVLARVAERRYGKNPAAEVVRAWRRISEAFTEFPYHGEVLYNAPMQLGPANLLWEKPTGYRASMVGFPYDDLETWRAVYPAEVFISQMDKVAAGFYEAATQLKSIQRPSPELQREIRVTEAAAIHFRSTANQARFVRSRRALADAKRSEDAHRALTELSQLLTGEIELAKRLHAIQSLDSRIGFEASNQYYYVPADLVEKVLNCRDLLERWIPGQREKWKV